MILSIAGMILSSSVFAATIRVPSEQPTIQAGIDVAVDGDTVLVADGTYTGDGNVNISISRAIKVTSENGSETCIIDCHGPHSSDRRGFWISHDSANVVVQGFTITHAYSTQGSGMVIVNSSPTIVDCKITHNYADWVMQLGAEGGGVCCLRGSPSFINCVISSNGAYKWGGGVCCHNSTPSFTNCTFELNFAQSGCGGAICCIDSSSPTLTNCIIRENNGLEGGGIYCDYYSSPILTNCIIGQNSSSLGGGIFCAGVSSPTLTNCTIYGNEAAEGGGLLCKYSAPELLNSVVWGNLPDQFMFTVWGSAKASFSNIQGGFPGIGNIDADPLFIGGDPFDYHLSSQSLCIDAGTDVSASPTDLDGKQRPRGGGVDMGAYEYQSWPLTVRTYVKMPSHEIFPGDVTSCSASVWNSEYEAIEESPLFVILDIMGTYYFAPSFSSYDYFERRFPFGLTKLTILPEFAWPANAGSAYAVWYAFLANHEQTELMSNIGVFDFSWSE